MYLKQDIRDNQSDAMNNQFHDRFDPNGNVQWCENSNSGFLTKSSSLVNWEEEYALKVQAQEENQVAHAFRISDKEELD